MLEHPADHFQQYKGHPGGWCRACRRVGQEKQRRIAGVLARQLSYIEGDKKLCMSCHELVPLSEFYRVARGLGGVAAYCRACVARRRSLDPESRARGREQTRRWREMNRAYHLAQHRVRMFERRHKVKVSSDGTVTVEFLTALYNQTACHYCKQETVSQARTADHVIPLSKGGAHSAANLVMACSTCNSSKRDKSAGEFISTLQPTPMA